MNTALQEGALTQVTTSELDLSALELYDIVWIRSVRRELSVLLSQEGLLQEVDWQTRGQLVRARHAFDSVTFLSTQGRIAPPFIVIDQKKIFDPDYFFKSCLGMKGSKILFLLYEKEKIEKNLSITSVQSFGVNQITLVRGASL